MPEAKRRALFRFGILFAARERCPCSAHLGVIARSVIRMQTIEANARRAAAMPAPPAQLQIEAPKKELEVPEEKKEEPKAPPTEEEVLADQEEKLEEMNKAKKILFNQLRQVRRTT